MKKIGDALAWARGWIVEIAAHAFAIWLSAARWISAHPHWALLVGITAFAIAVKF
jgi:hypothetical protein